MVNSLFLNPHGFIRTYLRNPTRTGSLAPATRNLAKLVAASTHDVYQKQPQSCGRLGLIELGAGTGALTSSIISLSPVLVECDEKWAIHLSTLFPSLEVRAECATLTLRNLTEPVGVVTSIPLLNNPQSVVIKRLLSEQYAAGLIKFCVLYTYGWLGPLSDGCFRQGRRTGFVARNFPPASVWVYQ